MRKLLALVAATLTLVGAGVPTIADASVPRATSFAGWPAVGAIFPTPNGTGAHFCTASVLHSTTGDLVLTAAHCVRGTGSGLSFVPDYAAGRTYIGAWPVTKVYANAPWKTGQSPWSDVAVLRVAHRYIGGRWRTIQSFTNGYQIGTAPWSGSQVWVPGYPNGASRPIVCRAPVRYASGFPAFDCDGYYDGTSGSPWIQTQNGVNYVRGVIGGPHQGGCTESVSYSSPFTTNTQALVARAEANGPSDVLPVPGTDGC